VNSRSRSLYAIAGPSVCLSVYDHWTTSQFQLNIYATYLPIKPSFNVDSPDQSADYWKLLLTELTAHGCASLFGIIQLCLASHKSSVCIIITEQLQVLILLTLCILERFLSIVHNVLRLFSERELTFTLYAVAIWLSVVCLSVVCL